MAAALQKQQKADILGSYSSATNASLQREEKNLARWEAVFFATDDEKLKFENMFAKNIYDSGNKFYMSWLPLKLVSVGEDINAFGLQKFKVSSEIPSRR